MNRKKDINDWILWFMIFELYMDKHDWKSLLFCLVGAVFLYMENYFIYEKWFKA